jgi:peptidyl-tRNA hydrolase, PTH1 family
MSGNGQSFECRLIVGLGNPGSDYQGTRHNAGFAVLESFLGRMPKGFEKSKGHQSALWTGRYAGRALTLQEPLTYMNLSGDAVSSLVKAERIQPEEILVVYDDMDLPLGSLRMRPFGGSGGHNGMKSIIERLGSENFPRLRVGIGRRPGAKAATKDYVLSAFEGDEKELFEKTVGLASDALVMALRRGVQAAMNMFNAKRLDDEEEAGAADKTGN